MKTKILFLVIIGISVMSCNSVSNRYDGSYSLNIQMFGVSVNSKVDLIINGDKMNYNGEILECKQYSDRVDVENGKLIFTAVNGDLVTDIPRLGKIRYVRVSGDNNLE
ncbi:MAG: hypothetical protein WBF83_04070 [Moheibacter sp.]